jgi:hypothetical protein
LETNGAGVVSWATGGGGGVPDPLILENIEATTAMTFSKRFCDLSATTTQAGSPTSAVSLNAENGTIITVNLTAGASPNVFTFNNTNILTTTIVRFTVADYAGDPAGTDGIPVVQCFGTLAGSRQVQIASLYGAATPLSAAALLFFELIQRQV